jgi:transcriptional regulator with XRE-family HTH domain
MSNEEIRKQVGRNVAAARHRSGLSQRELATRLAIATQEISRLEHGRRSCPSLPTLLPVARALGVPLTDLVQGIE